jgi:hypothetical protein
MIVFTHRTTPAGWQFDSEVGLLQGASATVEKSIADAEHAARHYLSRVQGYAVLPADAHAQVGHRILP